MYSLCDLLQPITNRPLRPGLVSVWIATCHIRGLVDALGIWHLCCRANELLLFLPPCITPACKSKYTGDTMGACVSHYATFNTHIKWHTLNGTFNMDNMVLFLPHWCIQESRPG